MRHLILTLDWIRWSKTSSTNSAIFYRRMYSREFAGKRNIHGHQECHHIGQRFRCRVGLFRNTFQFNRILQKQLYLIHRYFYLYRISYLWYSPIGFCITLFGGWVVSLIFTSCGIGGEWVIFLDEEKRMINADLFSPPIAKRLRLENAKYLEKNFSVSRFLQIAVIYNQLDNDPICRQINPHKYLFTG